MPKALLRIVNKGGLPMDVAYQELCRLDRADKEGSKSYLLEKSRLSLRLIVPMSDDRKAER